MAHAEILELEDEGIARQLYGHRDEYLRLLGSELTVDIHVRGTRIRIEGDPLDSALARDALLQLYRLAEQGRSIRSEDVVRTAQMLRDEPDADVESVLMDTVLKAPLGKTITPKTIGQKRYIECIRGHDIVFGIGPAGTGKTYLAMAMAIASLNTRRVQRIILTRPAVEAGEKLGFLPGDLAEKVSPYLRPLHDALNEMMDYDRIVQFTERGIIEVAPLAFMRGRTLNDAFVILDEAQNATREQMKMFLTRLGFGSRTVITGDVTQVDLARKTDSGLDHAVRILHQEKGVGVHRFSERDVVRHPLVRRIIAAYERDDAEREATAAPQEPRT
ncbi:MAG: PhoH family protein [Deltaproteobacteria bacterium]|nr:MAG: PhoH family protein [Deltaproteobacteria bacterium]